MSRYVRADQVNFMTVEDLTEPKRVWAKIRYNHRGAWCTVEKTEKMRSSVHLKSRRERSHWTGCRII